jgi:hypothetical protein
MLVGRVENLHRIWGPAYTDNISKVILNLYVDQFWVNT